MAFFCAPLAGRLGTIGAIPPRSVTRSPLVELLTSEAERALQLFTTGPSTVRTSRVSPGDFFRWLALQSGGPVHCGRSGIRRFIRYQNFPEPSRTVAMQMMRQHGFKAETTHQRLGPFHRRRGQPPPAWWPRLAMVNPAELLQVSYASQLRLFLVDPPPPNRIVTCKRDVLRRGRTGSCRSCSPKQARAAIAYEPMSHHMTEFALARCAS